MLGNAYADGVPSAATDIAADQPWAASVAGILPHCSCSVTCWDAPCLV